MTHLVHSHTMGLVMLHQHCSWQIRLKSYDAVIHSKFMYLHNTAIEKVQKTRYSQEKFATYSFALGQKLWAGQIKTWQNKIGPWTVVCPSLIYMHVQIKLYIECISALKSRQKLF